MKRVVCLLTFLSLKCFALEEFIFWAEPSSKNLALFHQSQNISLVMTKNKNRVSEYAYRTPYTQKDLGNFTRNELGLIEPSKVEQLTFLNSHKDELGGYFIGAKISVKDIVKTGLLKTKGETYVKILSLKLGVDFGENSALTYYPEKEG